jgi:uncharacterized protein
LNNHPLKGNLFENLVVIEFLKHRYNRGLRDNLSFYRDSQGKEVDLFIRNGNLISPVEIKSGETINTSFFDNLRYLREKLAVETNGEFLIYGGNQSIVREGVHITGWKKLPEFMNSNFKD